MFLSGVEVANSNRHVFGRDGRVKGRDRTFVNDWLTKKDLQKLFLKACIKSRECLNMNDFGLYSQETTTNDLKRGIWQANPTIGHFNDPFFKS